MTSPALPLEAETVLRSELNKSEQLIWTGQPLAPRAMQGSLLIVLLGVPWTAFSLFWVVMAIWMARGFTTQASSSPSSFPFNLMSFFFPLFGVPFVFIGLGMLSSPYWMRRKAQKTIYALTDERALILSPTWRGEITVRSIPPEHLTNRTRTQNSNGSGSIFFTRVTVTRRRAGPDGGTYEVPIGFENITNVREVETLIERTYRASE